MSSLFDRADAYRIAFSYRDIPAEVDLLLRWFARHRGGTPASVLELACGPGDHALEFARRDIATAALDLSAVMCARAAERAAAAGLRVEVVRADMTDFRLRRRFDLALLMLDSASLLLTDGAMSAFLDRAARHLTPGGLLVVDLSVRTRDDGRRPEWTVHAGGTSVRTRWGTPRDDYDPVTGVEQVRVRVSVTHRGAAGEEVLDEVIPARRWTGDQLRRLAPADRWEVVARYGSTGEDMDASDPRAVRDVAVLRRI